MAAPAKRKNLNIQQKMITYMKESAGKNTLWTRAEIMEGLDVEVRVAENALYNAWKTGKIFRHKTKTPDDQYRYAINMKEEFRDVFKPSDRARPGTSKRYKKKSQLPTAKELRKMFMDLQNQIAGLEDSVLVAIERLEEYEKMTAKIKQL